MGFLVRRFGLLAATLVVAACSSSSNLSGLQRDDEIRLPDRERERVEDAGKPLPPSPRGGSLPDASSPGTIDAGTDAAPPRSAFCSEADLVLCVEFEGAVKDGSLNDLRPATVQDVTFVTGKVGLGVALGTQSAIRFAHAPVYDVPAATIEAWVSVATDAQHNGVVFDADDRYAMEIESDGHLKCKSSGGSETGGVVVKGQLTHVACTFDSMGNIRNYVGGIERDTGSGQLGKSSVGGAAIGGNSPSGEPFVGIIDSLRVFRRARSAAEIAQTAQ